MSLLPPLVTLIEDGQRHILLRRGVERAIVDLRHAPSASVEIVVACSTPKEFQEYYKAVWRRIHCTATLLERFRTTPWEYENKRWRIHITRCGTASPTVA